MKLSLDLSVSSAQALPCSISRLAVFGGLGMSFNILRDTLGSLAMLTATRNASSRVSSFAVERRPGSFSK
jgi:hypothetical protein